MEPYQLAAVVAMTKKRCHDSNMLSVMLLALRHPDLVHAKQTKSGLMVLGPRGSASAHYTNSDIRATANFRAQLRRIGLYPTPRR